MSDALIQVALALFGLSAMWLATGAHPQARRWAPVVGLCGQPFWLAATWGAWGMFILCCAYTLVYLRGVLNQFGPWGAKDNHVEIREIDAAILLAIADGSGNSAALMGDQLVRSEIEKSGGERPMLRVLDARLQALRKAGKITFSKDSNRWMVACAQKTVVKIVEDHQRIIGAEGLVCPVAECGCRLKELVTCDSNFSECQPAWEGRRDGDWAMFTTKELAQASVRKGGA